MGEYKTNKHEQCYSKKRFVIILVCYFFFLLSFFLNSNILKGKNVLVFKFSKKKNQALKIIKYHKHLFSQTNIIIYKTYVTLIEHSHWFKCNLKKPRSQSSGEQWSMADWVNDRPDF